MNDIEKLEAANAELSKLQKEVESFKAALGDPKLTAWVSDRGRAAPRSLSSFEMASVKRINAAEQKICKLEAERDRLLEDIICGVARKRGDGLDDPELLLRASMISLHRLHKAGHSTGETRAVTQALLRYLKSLEED